MNVSQAFRKDCLKALTEFGYQQYVDEIIDRALAGEQPVGGLALMITTFIDELKAAKGEA